MRVHLTDKGRNDAQDRLRRLIARRVGGDDGVAAAHILLASIPDQGAWVVPREAVGVAQKMLYGLPDIDRAVRVAKLMQRKASADYLKRMDLARKMFNTWVGSTNPDIQAITWHNLNEDDRNYWIDQAEQQLYEGEK